MSVQTVQATMPADPAGGRGWGTKFHVPVPGTDSPCVYMSLVLLLWRTLTRTPRQDTRTLVNQEKEDVLAVWEAAAERAESIPHGLGELRLVTVNTTVHSECVTFVE